MGVIGEPRTTGDVDVIAFASAEDAESLIARASNAGFEVHVSLERQRLRETGTLRFRQGSFQLDIIVASLPFEEAAYARAVTTTLFGRPLLLPTPEDLILLKVLAGRDKDLVDATGVARRHLGRLDLRYLEETIQGICDLAEDVQPWRRLERVLSKASME